MNSLAFEIINETTGGGEKGRWRNSKKRTKVFSRDYRTSVVAKNRRDLMFDVEIEYGML